MMSGNSSAGLLFDLYESVGKKVRSYFYKSDKEAKKAADKFKEFKFPFCNLV